MRTRNAAGDVLLGIDIGTTELKAGAFDARTGKALASAAHRLGVQSAPDGTRQQRPDDVIAALRSVAGRLRTAAGGAWRHVAGIGLAAQGGSAILCDRRTGRALTAMQLWNDTRPLALLGEIASRRPAGYWRRLCGLGGPGAGLARIEWLRRRRPRLVPADAHDLGGKTLYGGAGEFAFFALTGVWRQDAGNALQIGCYSVPRQALVADALEAVGVPLSFVAPLRQGHQIHPLAAGGARLLGLPAGVPVAGPYIDHEAGYLSATGLGGRPLQCSLGTAWVGNLVAETALPPSGGLDLVLPSPVGAGSLVLRVMAGGNLTWDWGLETLMSPRRSEALKKADAVFAEALLPPDGLTAFPWFTRPNVWDAALPGNGGFLGLGVHTSRADLLRALAAGMCFEFASLFADVRTAGLVDRVVLGGGAARGPAFDRLLAELLAPLPVFVAEDQHLAAARGSIYAFSPQAARVNVQRVRCGAAGERGRISRQYEQYRKVRDTVWPEEKA